MTRLAIAIVLMIATSAAAPTIRVGIHADNGRHSASVEGLPPGSTPGLEEAVAQLLDCPVERASGGFRCRERRLIEGLDTAGQLDFQPLLRLPGLHDATALVLLPPSPRSTVSLLSQQPPGWWPSLIAFTGPAPHDQPLRYHLGFFWQTVAVDLAPLPFLLFWAVRLPEPRLGFAVAMSFWLAWLAASGTLAVDSFFWFVPSVEGAFLRWIGWLPLWVLILAQSRWLGMRSSMGVWVPVVMLVLLRPRSAHWMTFSEQTLADLLSIALLALVTAPMVLRGRNGATLPEAVQVAVRRRAPDTSKMDLRLDGPDSGDAPVKPRLGRLVSIPAAWLERLSGPVLEAAVLLAVFRTRHAPVARSLGLLVGVWIVFKLPAQRLPWLIVLAPLVAVAGFTWFERRWESAIAAEARSLSGEPGVWPKALAAMRPEWGASATRVAARLSR